MFQVRFQCLRCEEWLTGTKHVFFFLLQVVFSLRYDEQCCVGEALHGFANKGSYSGKILASRWNGYKGSISGMGKCAAALWGLASACFCSGTSNICRRPV